MLEEIIEIIQFRAVSWRAEAESTQSESMRMRYKSRSQECLDILQVLEEKYGKQTVTAGAVDSSHEVE